MFKKRGGLAFKPKLVKRAPAAGIATPQQSGSADTPEETTTPIPDTTVQLPDIPQTAADTIDTNATEPPPPVSSSDRDAPSESDKPRRLSEVAEPSIEAVTTLDVPGTDTAPRPHDSPSTPVDLIQSQAALEVQIAQDKPDAPGAEAEKESLEQSGVPSSEVLETPAEVTASDSVPTLSTPEPSKKKKGAAKAAPSKSKAAKATSESSQPKKRQRRTKRSQEDEEGHEGEGNVDDSQTGAKKRPRKSKEGSKEGSKESCPTKGRRARSLTPEDAEAQLVDHQKLTMADLTRDLHIGKKFSRHDELRERERQVRAKAKSGKDDGEAWDTPSSAAGSPKPDASNTESTKQTAPPTPGEQQQGSGVQFRMVDGQIVLDQSSLVMDRHARAAATQRDMETIEENDFTRLITSSSYMSSSKLKGPNIWTAEETVLFYRGLEMFGTDFEIIAQMFPGKQRRQVKLKFNREERHNPKLVDAALIGVKKTRMNIDEYKALTGGEFESVESIEAQHREQEEHFEARQKQLADEQAEIMRKKKEELFADNDGSAGTGDGTKKKRGKKRQLNSASLGDPEVIMDL